MSNFATDTNSLLHPKTGVLNVAPNPSGGQGMALDPRGHLPENLWQNAAPPCIKLVLTSSQTIATGTITPLVCQKSVLSANSNIAFTATQGSGTIKALLSGWYVLSLAILWNGGVADVTNGMSYISGVSGFNASSPTAPTNFATSLVTVTTQITAAATFVANAFQTSGVNQNVTHAEFTAMRICAF